MHEIDTRRCTFLALAALALTAAGCLSISLGTRSSTTVRAEAAPHESFVLKLSGAEGMRFTGTVTTDGAVQQLEGALPYEFRVSARTLSCEFKKQGGEGPIALEVVRGDPSSGSRSTVSGAQGVRAEFGGSSIVSGF